MLSTCFVTGYSIVALLDKWSPCKGMSPPPSRHRHTYTHPLPSLAVFGCAQPGARTCRKRSPPCAWWLGWQGRQGGVRIKFPPLLSNYWPIWYCLFNCFNYDGTSVAQHPGVKACIIHVQHPGLHSELWVWAECQYHLIPPVEQGVVCIDSRADKESNSKWYQRRWIVMPSSSEEVKRFFFFHLFFF